MMFDFSFSRYISKDLIIKYVTNLLGFQIVGIVARRSSRISHLCRSPSLDSSPIRKHSKVDALRKIGLAVEQDSKQYNHTIVKTTAKILTARYND